MSKHEPKPVAWGNFKQDGTLVGLAEEKNENWTGAEPLYPASDITALQEQVGRLKAKIVEIGGPCSLGVGCEQYGVCYADAHGQPDQCGKPDTACDVLRDARRIADHDKKLWLAAEARANAAEQRLKEAVKVLEPFLRLDEGFIGQRTDEDVAQVTWTPNGPHKITFGQIRAARAFIKEAGE